jgi:hypothetical protein
VIHAGFQQVDAADQIDLRVEGRVLDRSGDLCLGGMVVDDLRAKLRDHPLDVFSVPKVDLVKMRCGVEIALVPSAEVVDYRHVVTGGNVGVDDVGADEAGAARYENPHGQ